MNPSDPWRPLSEALLGRAELTALDVARESGIEPNELRRLWQALGFPPVTDDEPRFTRADVDVVRAVRALVEVNHADPGDVLQLTRVVGHAMAAVTDAQLTLISERFQSRLEQGGDSQATAESPIARIQMLAPALEQFLGYVWRRHIVAAAVQLGAAPSAVDRELIVGFADMVGFTAMTQALDAAELTTLVNRFEAAAHEHIVKNGGRVVKMIGDAVMFSVDDAGRAGEIALSLRDAHAATGALPAIRVGVACGPVLAWEGDLFGPTVNLASRLVSFARPATVLVSEDLADQLGAVAGFEIRHLGPVKLKGLGKVRSAVLRRPRCGARG